jgi:hypothetical protein
MGYVFGTILLVLGLMMRFVGGKATTSKTTTSVDLPALGLMVAMAGAFAVVLGTP